MARRKKRESEKKGPGKRTLVCRRKSQAIFDGRRRVPRKFMEFSGDSGIEKNSPFFPLVSSHSKRMGGNKREKGARNRRNNGSLRASIFDRCPEKTREKNPPGTDLRSVPRVFLSDQRWLCRKWHAIFGKAISVRLSTCFTRSFRAPIRDRCPEGTVVSSDFDTFSSSDISPDSFGVRGKPVLFLKEKGPGREKNSPFFRRKKGPEIGGKPVFFTEPFHGSGKKF